MRGGGDLACSLFSPPWVNPRLSCAGAVVHPPHGVPLGGDVRVPAAVPEDGGRQGGGGGHPDLQEHGPEDRDGAAADTIVREPGVGCVFFFLFVPLCVCVPVCVFFSGCWCVYVVVSVSVWMYVGFCVCVCVFL